MRKSVASSIRRQVVQICGARGIPFSKMAYRRAKRTYLRVPSPLRSTFSLFVNRPR